MALRKVNSQAERDLPSLAALIPIRVDKRAVRGVGSRRSRRPSLDSFFTRVLASSLLISLPAMVILAALMFAQELQSSTDLANGRAQSTATAAAGRITEWVREPAAYLAQLASEAIVPVGSPEPNGSSLKTATNASFDAIAVVDSNGVVIATTARDPDLEAVGSAVGFREMLYRQTLLPIDKGKDGLDWIISAPIVGGDGISEGVVTGDLNITALSPLLGPTTSGQEIHVANSKHLLVFSSDWRPITGDRSLAARGALSVTAEGGLVDRALTNGPGSAQIPDYRNHAVFAGYGAASNLQLVVIASPDSAEALSPAYTLARLTIAIMIVGALLIVGAAIILPRFTIRPTPTLPPLPPRPRAARGTSARVEEVGRASGAIADPVDRVAIQAGEAQTNLERAQTDPKASGDRPLALAGRVNEIEGILELIDDLAD